ncbi:motilin-like isoform X2 [Entelurus aequoreus]|uniref:motilin-like isoform X2 n=1 Tax=Entelurus aequoreus TaxID=161455 RepID=UPI002B1E1B44|nr:motilin-like isoform X2 [Entelurus aequoreus]
MDGNPFPVRHKHTRRTQRKSVEPGCEVLWRYKGCLQGEEVTLFLKQTSGRKAETTRQSRMSIRGASAACVALLCVVVLMAETTHGHITFFSPKEMMLMKEREGRKDMEPRSEDGHFEEVTVEQLPPAEHATNLDKTVDITVRLSPKQLDHVAPVLEELIHEMVEERQKGTAVHRK